MIETHTHEFHAAPWPTILKVSSGLVGLLVIGVGYGMVKAMPPYGLAHTIGLLVAWSIPAMLIGSLLFIVTGFAVDQRSLYVRRMLWSTRLDLHGLRRVWTDPQAMKGSIRIFGNGGLFSFSGIYRNKKLGRYRLFATDPSRAVVLIRPEGTIVITPEDPERFVQAVRGLYPSVQERAAE